MITRNLTLTTWIRALTKLFSARKSQKTTSNVLKNSIHFLPLLILVSVTIISLAPFSAKAFNIDEPLFIWVAKHIQSHPLDFYGFRINWYGSVMDAAQIIKNPPLAAYYIALAAYLSGWNEIPLHLAFLLPAIAATTGTYFLAREFTRHPLTATLIGILNPVFILSGTTVMCDVMMLAFYVWAIFFWVRGIKKDDGCRDHFIAVVLITLCCLTKYFGLSLIPLLFLYTRMAGEGRRQRAAYLLIPIAILSVYQLGTYAIYGRGLLSDAASYASKEKALNFAAIFPNLVTGLSFTGGGLISTLFFVPQLWNKRTVLASAILIPVAAFALSRLNFSHLPETPWWGYYLQLSVFVAAGVNILVLAGHDLWQRRESDAMFLVLWIMGTFVFAAIINWSVNGRSILPMAPAAGIGVMRFLENKNGETWQPGIKQMLIPLSCAWLVCMMVTWADFSLAETARAAATEIGRTYGSTKPLWFQGHWGFQYYMEKNGGTAYDRKKSSIQPGDIMVMPENNTNAFPEIMAQGTPLQLLQFAPARFLTTMNFAAGAGYYSSGFGPIPFLVDKAPEERYHVVVFPPAHQP